MKLQNSHRSRIDELQNPCAFLLHQAMENIQEFSAYVSALLMAHVDSIWCVCVCVWLRYYSDLPGLFCCDLVLQQASSAQGFHLHLHISSPARCGSPLLDDLCLSLTSIPTKNIQNIKLFHILQYASSSYIRAWKPKVWISATIPLYCSKSCSSLFIYFQSP